MEGHPNWKGGQCTSNGYVFVKQADHPHAISKGYVRRSRLAMEKKIGRLLKPEEVAITLTVTRWMIDLRI
jgi:hypothetical protein